MRAILVDYKNSSSTHTSLGIGMLKETILEKKKHLVETAMSFLIMTVEGFAKR